MSCFVTHVLCQASELERHRNGKREGSPDNVAIAEQPPPDAKKPRKKRTSKKAKDIDAVIRACVGKNVKVEELKSCFRCCVAPAGIRCRDRANQVQPAR